MTFTYNNGVPAANDNPSDDQPDMLVNAQSINSIWAVNHIGFNADNGGTHTQIDFKNDPNYLPAPASPTNNAAVLYTLAGVASNPSNLNFVNANATFPLCFIRAWASCTQAGITAPQSFNVTSVTRTGVGLYDVVLPANTITGTNYGVIGAAASTAVSGFWFTYTITGATTFSLKILSQGLTEPSAFNFMVIQL